MALLESTGVASMSEILEGRCLCGAVAFEVQGPVERVSHCHCSMCRKGHGAAFATYGTVRAAQHRFTQGEAHIGRYVSSPTVERCFCTRCGSPLLWHEPGSGWLAFPLGALETAWQPAQHMHIFVASKAPWFEITDHWPQYVRSTGAHE